MMSNAQYYIKLASDLIRKHAPKVLSMTGCIGVATTSVLAAKAAIKIKEKNEQTGNDLTVIQKVKNSFPEVIPAVVSGILTMSCIAGSSIINEKQKLALCAMYEALAVRHDIFKEATKKVVDEKTYEEIESTAIRDELDLYQKIGRVDTDDKDIVWFHDEYVGFYGTTMSNFYYSWAELNRLFILRGYATLNDWYRILGIEDRSPQGEDVGWSYDAGVEYGYAYIDIVPKVIPKTTEYDMDLYSCEFVFEPTIDAIHDEYLVE